MALGSTQPLTEMSTRSISWGKGGRCVKADNLNHHPVPLSRNLRTLTSWNPLGLSRPVMGLLYLYTGMVYVIQLFWQQTCMTYAIPVYAVKNCWWWTEELSETCRVLFQKWIWDISTSSWFYYKNLLRCMVTWTSKSAIGYMLMFCFFPKCVLQSSADICVFCQGWWWCPPCSSWRPSPCSHSQSDWVPANRRQDLYDGRRRTQVSEVKYAAKCYIFVLISKGKCHPSTGHEGPEGE